MKKLTSLLIGCSLALAGAALAQQPVEQQSPTKGKRAPEKAHATQAQPGANAAKPQERPAKQTGAMKERGTTNEHGATNQSHAEKSQKTHASHEPANAPETNVPGKSTDEATNEPGAGKGRKNRAHEESGNAPATGTDVSGHAAGMPTQKGKEQQVQAVTFNQNHRIEGSDRWQGQHYEVFRSYHPEWHDQGWYHSHYNRVELIAGGYYFFNNGYWFPAWGYSPSAQYYAYDAPIYVGQRAVPPDKVIADVQALLQQMGYYTGEVDGLLGPLTREALTAYQADQGLTATAVIDQPTLDSLGLA